MYDGHGFYSNPLSFSPSLNLVQNTKKRKRQPSESEPLPPAADTSDGKIKPRRIDPDRLAIRLGPELVSEMDAFIVPGAKMPSFEVRQTLVQKYNVDRRHIYDYLHSRGLRVAKEDKHLNLSHRMSRKPGAARKPSATSRKPAASQVTAPVNIDPPNPYNSIQSSTSGTQAIITLPKSLKSTNSSKRRIVEASPPAPLSQRSTPLLFSEPMDLSSDSSSSEDDSSPVSSTFEFPDLTESSSFGEDLESVSLGYPLSKQFSESLGLDFPPSSSMTFEDFPLFGFDELQTDSESISSSVCNPLLPLDDLSRLLSQSERMEFYNLLNDRIGPARGIEESAGTYKAHMERLYFNRWDSGASQYHYSYPSSPPTLVVPPVQAAPMQPRPPTMIEKENIDPRLPAPRNTTNSGLSKNHYYPQTASLSSRPHDHNSHHVSSSSRREYPPTPPSQLMSPVAPKVSDSDQVPTRTATPPPRYPLPTPLIWTSPIKNSQSTSFLRTQQWQTQTSQAFTTSNTFAIPYVYSTTGDRARIVHKPTLEEAK